MSDDVTKRLAVLETLNRLNLELRDVNDADEAYTLIAQELRRATKADFTAIAIIVPSGQVLELRGVAGVGRPISNLPTIKFDESFRKRMSDAKSSVAFRMDKLEDFPKTGMELRDLLKIERAIISSILLRGEFYGYLVIANKEGSPSFPLEMEEIMRSISDDIALVVESVQISLELKRAKEETEKMLSMAPICLFTCDSRGIFTSINKQMLEILDAKSEEALLGTSVFEIPVVNKSGLDALIMSGMEGHDAEKGEVHVVSKPDKAYYLHVKLTPMRGDAGEVKGVLVVAMDITSKVRLQNQLERSYEKLTQTYQELERVTKMKSQFIDIVSHELRTPLTVMRGYIDLVESEYAPKLEPKFGQRFKIIKANTDKLYSLVESMLDVSRLEKGSLQIHAEPVRIDGILEDIVRDRMPDAESKKQTLVLDVEGQLPLIMADRRRVKDVFNNLIDNALKYTQEGGHVQVNARDEGRMIHVSVKDNGVGIPLEQLGRIFDRFHIVTSNDLSHQVDRLGLGLPITKGIIEAHLGRIWVESQVGKGSVFHVELPKESPK